MNEYENKTMKANQLALEAWDLLGCKAGSLQIKVPPNQENLVLAKRKIDEAIYTDKKSIKAQSVLATYYTLTKDYGNAEVTHKKILQADPTNAITYCNLAEVFMKMGKYMEAEAAYKKSIEWLPTRWASHHNLAQLYVDIKKDSLALQEYEISISLNSDQVDSYHDLALLHFRNGNPQKSIDVINLALKNIKGDKERSMLFGLLGLQYQKLKRIDEAKDAFGAAVELDKANGEVIENSAMFFLEIDEVDRAIEYFSAAKKVEPENLQHSYHIAISYLKKKSTSEAICEFNEILKRDPFYLDVKEKLKALNDLPNKSSHSAS